MIIPTSDLIKYDGTDWKGYLKGILLYDVFESLFLTYRGNTLTGIMRYIIWTYSIDSDKIVLHQEWLSNKKKIFKICDISEELFDDVVMLKSEDIGNAIILWLNYQNESNFSSWAMYNDLIIEMRTAANSPLKKGITKENPDGIIDYDQKMKCAESVAELIVKKEEVEQKFLQNNEKLREAYKEMSNTVVKKKGDRFGLETMLKQIKN